MTQCVAAVNVVTHWCCSMSEISVNDKILIENSRNEKKWGSKKLNFHLKIGLGVDLTAC